MYRRSVFVLSESELKPAKKKFEYKWVIIAAAFAMVFTCLGFCSSNKSLYLNAITAVQGIERSLFSINDSCRYITTAVVNLFFGTLISKFGARKMIGAGFLCLIASTLIYAFADNIFVFYIGGCLLGMGLSWCTTTMVGYVVNCWCKEHKGTIMGLVLAANGLGGALAAQIVTPIIYGSDFGYRSAYLLVAIILAVVGTVVVVLFRDAPKENAGDVPKKKARATAWKGLTFEQAVRKPYFYTTALCIFCVGFALQGVNGVAGSHLKDVGLDSAFVATVMSIHSLVLAASKFLTGIAYDKFGLRKTLIFCQAMAIVAFISLALVAPNTSGMTLAVVYGVTSSFALPLETIMLPLIAGDVFGQASYAKMMGIIVSINTAGYAIGTPIANLVYDKCGTYAPILFVLAGLMVVVAVVFQLNLNVVAKDKAALAAAEVQEQ